MVQLYGQQLAVVGDGGGGDDCEMALAVEEMM
jgi:hypothetical protein